jgi:hypothetical protein
MGLIPMPDRCPQQGLRAVLHSSRIQRSVLKQQNDKMAKEIFYIFTPLLKFADRKNSMCLQQGAGYNSGISSLFQGYFNSAILKEFWFKKFYCIQPSPAGLVDPG